MSFLITRAFQPRLPGLRTLTRPARELSRPAKASRPPFLTRPSHASEPHWPKSTCWLENRLKKSLPSWKAIQMCIWSWGGGTVEDQGADHGQRQRQGGCLRAWTGDRRLALRADHAQRDRKAGQASPAFFVVWFCGLATA